METEIGVLVIIKILNEVYPYYLDLLQSSTHILSHRRRVDIVTQVSPRPRVNRERPGACLGPALGY